MYNIKTLPSREHKLPMAQTNYSEIVLQNLAQTFIEFVCWDNSSADWKKKHLRYAGQAKKNDQWLFVDSWRYEHVAFNRERNLPWRYPFSDRSWFYNIMICGNKTSLSCKCIKISVHPIRMIHRKLLYLISSDYLYFQLLQKRLGERAQIRWLWTIKVRF